MSFWRRSDEVGIEVCSILLVWISSDGNKIVVKCLSLETRNIESDEVVKWTESISLKWGWPWNRIDQVEIGFERRVIDE